MDCRIALNNILDWGLGVRSKEVKEMLKKLHERYREDKDVKSKGAKPE